MKFKRNEFAVSSIVGVAVGFVFGGTDGDYGKNNGSDNSDDCRDEAGLPFLEDTEDENGDNSEAIDDCKEVIREAIFEATDETDADGGEKNGHGGEDEAGVPLTLFQIPANETGWEGREGDFEPIGVVLEEAPAHVTKRYLNQIDEGLGDEKENKHFEGGIERGFAVYDDKDGGEDPPFRGDSDVVERIAIRDEESHEGGIDAHDDGKDDEFGPGDTKTAEEFMEEILAFFGCFGRFRGGFRGSISLLRVVFGGFVCSHALIIAIFDGFVIK